MWKNSHTTCSMLQRRKGDALSSPKLRTIFLFTFMAMRAACVLLAALLVVDTNAMQVESLGEVFGDVEPGSGPEPPPPPSVPPPAPSEPPAPGKPSGKGFNGGLFALGIFVPGLLSLLAQAPGAKDTMSKHEVALKAASVVGVWFLGIMVGAGGAAASFAWGFIGLGIPLVVICYAGLKVHRLRQSGQPVTFTALTQQAIPGDARSDSLLHPTPADTAGSFVPPEPITQPITQPIEAPTATQTSADSQDV